MGGLRKGSRQTWNLCYHVDMNMSVENTMDKTGSEGSFSQRFKTGKECMATNNVIQAAYDQGLNARRRETKLLMEQALKNICWFL